MIFLGHLEALFSWLLTASWQASVLAICVLAVQRLLGSRLNPRWRYALWLLVVVRLVLPALPESAWSLFQFAPPPPAALTISVTEPLFATAPIASTMAVEEPLPPTQPFTAYSLLAILWLAGAAALALATAMVNSRFARQMASAPAITDPELLRVFDETKAELNIRRAIRLVESGQVSSPAIMGLFTPTLLLPRGTRERFDATELRLIFLHELSHLKRGDVVVQALIALLQVVHWFNPVLWFAFRRMRIDREPATDALVLSRAGEAEKERYGLMLIKLLENFSQRHSLATLVGILEDKDQFKRRFSLIARFTRGAYGWSLLGVVLLAILGVACLTKAKATVTSMPHAKTPAASIFVESTVALTSEANCQRFRTEFEAAVKRGNLMALEQLGILKVIGRPAVYSSPGQLIVLTLGDAIKQDYAVTVNLTAMADQDHFTDTGEFWLTSIEDPSAEEIKKATDKGKTEMAPHVTSHSVNIYAEMTAGQTKVVEMPDIPAHVFRNAFPGEPSPSGQQRLLLFLTTKAVAKTADASANNTTAATISPPSSAADTNRAKIIHKLQTIVFDQVDFEHQDIMDVIQQLTQKCRQIDPDKEGVSFVLRLDSGSGGGSTSKPDPQIHRDISLHLHNATLAEIVGNIVQQTKLSYALEDYAVYLRPPSVDENTLTVRTYLVPADFLSITLPAPGESTSTDGKESVVTNRLENLGFKFPSGARATYLPDSNKLIVRNTPEQLDLIAEYIARLNPAPISLSPSATSPAPISLSRNQPIAAPVAAGQSIENAPAKAAANATVAPSPAGAITAHAVSGRLFGQNPSPVDYAKSRGELLSVDRSKGHHYVFAFQANGSFVIPNVAPDVYNVTVHLVPKIDTDATTADDLIDNTLPSPLTVDATSGKTNYNVNIGVSFKKPKGSIEISLKVVEIDDDVYQANKEKVDAAVEKGDIGFFNNLKVVSLLATPSVTTMPGLKANVDIVREFPYPTSFDPAKIIRGALVPPTPREFVTKDVGVSAEITPTIDNGNSPDHGKIILNGKFSVVDFEGFTKSNLEQQLPNFKANLQVPTFSTTESLFVEALDDNQMKGFWVPGEHVAQQNPTAANFTPDWQKNAPMVKKRFLLFVSAKLVK